jgi:hypothetical protein
VGHPSTPPPPGGAVVVEPSGKRPLWKRWWVFTVAAFIALGLIASPAGGANKDDEDVQSVVAATTDTAVAATSAKNSDNGTATTEQRQRNSDNGTATTEQRQRNSDNGTSATTQAPPATQAPPTTSVETLSQENAHRKAADYLEYLSFSRSGLINQLEFEGFTRVQAEYGAAAAGF